MSAAAAEEDKRIAELVSQWLEWDTCAETRAEVEALRAKWTSPSSSSDDAAAARAELKSVMLKRIAFGTAGLRGPMRAGFACMNELTVRQASQGLAAAVLRLVPNAQAKGVAVGYDGRHNSRRFAEIAAHTFASRGLRVLLFSRVVPTPFVPYCVSHRGCCAGVMVTASHNPARDNGYKVYWDNGCQIVSPVDAEIARDIDANLAPWPAPAEPLPPALVEDPLADIVERYFADCVRTLCYTRDANEARAASGTARKIVYTAMHGVGAWYVERAFKAFGLAPYVGVVEQLEPNGDFPTVAFPNPEEGRGALALAMATAEKSGASLIIATDPDADRLAAAERQADGSWRLFNGNELGAMLGHWALVNWRKAHPDVPADRCVMISTAVSSRMLAAVAQKEGLVFEEVLTGFKWIGTAAYRHIHEHKRELIFAYEEAIGYMLGDMSLDKDGVRAAAVFGEMANAQPGLLSDYLASLYKQYGYFASCNKYFFCYDPALLERIFERLRADRRYPTQCGRWKVRSVRDLTVGFDSTTPGNVPLLPVSASTQMITLTFENGCVATLRGSGTEPKLKYYIELSGALEDKQRIDAELAEMVVAITEECLQPTQNGLTRPSN